MDDLEQFIHDLKGYAKAYPEKIFTPLSHAERGALPPATVDRLSAEVGRHFAPTFTRAAAEIERLRAALQPFANEARSIDAVDRNWRVTVPCGWLADAKKALADADTPRDGTTFKAKD